MAFKVWITDNNVSSTNLLSGDDFSTNAERLAGFQSNSVASAKNVNSAVRQANLIAVALMESMGITGLDLTSSLADVKSAIDSYFTNAFNAKLGTSGDASNVKVNFTQSTTGTLTSGRSLANLFGTLSAWCASFGTLATKSVVEAKDVKDGAITSNKILDGQITTEKFADTAKAPFAGTADKTTTTSFTNASWLNPINTYKQSFVVSKTADIMTFEFSIRLWITTTDGTRNDCDCRQIMTVNASGQYSTPLAIISPLNPKDYTKASDVQNICMPVLESKVNENNIELKIRGRYLNGNIGDISGNYLEIRSVSYRVIQ